MRGSTGPESRKRTLTALIASCRSVNAALSILATFKIRSRAKLYSSSPCLRSRCSSELVGRARKGANFSENVSPEFFTDSAVAKCLRGSDKT